MHEWLKLEKSDGAVLVAAFPPDDSYSFRAVISCLREHFNLVQVQL